jgi:hypothetical protein
MVKRVPESTISLPAMRDAAGHSESMVQFKRREVLNVVWEPDAWEAIPFSTIFKQAFD